jgi:hypothetical protein
VTPETSRSTAVGVTLIRRGGLALASLIGRALGIVFYLAGKARAGHRKALHPDGRLRQGIIRREGRGDKTGVSWIDEAGTDHVLVRLSRSTGAPRPLPDVLGMALRVPVAGDRHGDLLLATTGTGPVSRFILRLARRPGSRYGSLMPYRTPLGPLLLAALPTAEDGSRFALACSRLSGPWSQFAELEVLPRTDDTEDRAVSFDPVLNIVPGLDGYRWAAELRRFSYAASRRSRGAVPG